MKLLETTSKVRKSGGTGQSTEFSFKASPKAARILSDQLYKDKVSAVIRELSTNARDSHIEAGKPNVPFKVSIPTEVNPYFYIRDYGVGLSPEDIKSIYTTYFESTKTHSNDVIGCLGLGSKTPLAYADNYGLNSYWNGKKYSYIVYWAQNGMPALDEISCLDTEEENGIEIKIAVKKGDIREFQDKARSIYQWFEIKPDINLDIPSIEVSHEGKLFKLRKVKNNYYSPKEPPVAIMGEIAYPLFIDEILSKVPSSKKDMVETALKNPFIYHFNLGELDIQASREELSYDPKTTKKLCLRIQEATEELVKEYIERFDNVKTCWDANLLLTNIKIEINNHQIYQLICSFLFQKRKDLFPNKGSLLFKRFGEEITTFSLSEKLDKSTWRREKYIQKEVLSSDISLVINPLMNKFFVFIEDWKANEARIKEFMMDLYKENPTKNEFFNVIRFRYNIEQAPRIAEQIEKIGIPEDKIIFAEHFFSKKTFRKQKTKTAKKKVSRQKSEIFEYKYIGDPKSSTSKIAYWEPIKDFQIKKNAYYVDTHRNAIVAPPEVKIIEADINKKMSDKWFDIQTILGKNIQIIGIPSSSSRLKEKINLPNFFVELKRKYDIYKTFKFDLEAPCYSYSFGSFAEKFIKTYDNNHILKKFYLKEQERFFHRQLASSLRLVSRFFLGEIFSDYFLNGDKSLFELYKFISKEKYPLLENAISDSFDEANLYIQSIDMLEKGNY